MRTWCWSPAQSTPPPTPASLPHQGPHSLYQAPSPGTPPHPSQQVPATLMAADQALGSAPACWAPCPAALPKQPQPDPRQLC